MGTRLGHVTRVKGARCKLKNNWRRRNVVDATMSRVSATRRDRGILVVVSCLVLSAVAFKRPRDVDIVDQVDSYYTEVGGDIRLELVSLEDECNVSDVFWNKKHQFGALAVRSYLENGSLYYSNGASSAYRARLSANDTCVTIHDATVGDSGVYSITVFCHGGKRYRFFSLVKVYDSVTPPSVTTVSVSAGVRACALVLRCDPANADQSIMWVSEANPESWNVRYYAREQAEYIDAHTDDVYGVDMLVYCKAYGAYSDANTSVSLSGVCYAHLRARAASVLAVLVTVIEMLAPACCLALAAWMCGRFCCRARCSHTADPTVRSSGPEATGNGENDGADAECDDPKSPLVPPSPSAPARAVCCARRYARALIARQYADT